MEISALLIKYILHKGVQLKHTNFLVSKINIDLTGDIINDYIKNLEEVECNIETVSSNDGKKLYYYLVRNNRRYLVEIKDSINKPTKNKLKVLLRNHEDYIELIYWENA